MEVARYLRCYVRFCAKIAEARTGAQVFVGHILDANFPRESFDVITCAGGNVLEHLYRAGAT